MKNIKVLSENFQLLVVKFSIYLNRRVFVMRSAQADLNLSWVHISDGTLSHAAKHILSLKKWDLLSVLPSILSVKFIPPPQGQEAYMTI